VLVQALLPRRSWLARPDPAHPERRLVLAANLDRVVCVVAAKAPRWKPGFVERVLLAASEGRARGLLVVNKVDLLSEPEREELLRALAPFRELADAQVVSARTGEGLAAVVHATRAATCVLVGPSGVGKSSLVNALGRAMGPGPALPEERTTAPVRPSDGKGRHTTTAAELVRLGNGACWIDTPGVRQFALSGIAPGELAALFPEVVAHARSCRFRDCAHGVEPACGVRAALESGRLDERRVASYRRLLDELRHAGGPGRSS